MFRSCLLSGAMTCLPEKLSSDSSYRAGWASRSMIAVCECRDSRAVLFLARFLATNSWWWWCRNVISQCALNFGFALGFDLFRQDVHEWPSVPREPCCGEQIFRKQQHFQRHQEFFFPRSNAPHKVNTETKKGWRKKPPAFAEGAPMGVSKASPRDPGNKTLLSCLALSASIWRYRAGEGGRHRFEGRVALPAPLDRSTSPKFPSKALPNKVLPSPRPRGILVRTGDEHKLREVRGDGAPPQISPFRVEGSVGSEISV